MEFKSGFMKMIHSASCKPAFTLLAAIENETDSGRTQKLSALKDNS